MLTGHASHQIGLDADVWLNPMPPRVLTAREREEISAVSVVNSNYTDVDPKVWTPEHLKVIRMAALMPDVERVLVNPAIKKALCREAKGDRSWLAKVRPYWGHNYHMHLRIGCPDGGTSCRPQDPVTGGEGCDASLDYWLKQVKKPDVPPPPPQAHKAEAADDAVGFACGVPLGSRCAGRSGCGDKGSGRRGRRSRSRGSGAGTGAPIKPIPAPWR